MSLINRVSMPVPALLRRYPELAGVSFPDTYRNDGVPLLLQDGSSPEASSHDMSFPLEFISEIREHQPRERRSFTAALTRRRQTKVGALVLVRLATRPFIEVSVNITHTIESGRHVLGRIETGPDAGRHTDVVIGPRWPWDVLVQTRPV